MQKPVEIDADEEAVEIVERVAAVDVAKAAGMVCTPVPHGSIAGKRVTKAREAKATTAAILELAGHLACQGVQQVVLESAPDYWRPFYYVLEARGLTVWLVNASPVRHAPGRPKSDKIEAVAGQAQRAQHDLALVRATGKDPADPGLDPGPVRPGR